MGSNNIAEIKRIEKAYGISRTEAWKVYNIISSNGYNPDSFINKYPIMLSWKYRRVFVPDDVKDHLLEHRDIDLDEEHDDHNVISWLGVDSIENNVSQTNMGVVDRVMYTLYDMETKPTKEKAL